MASTVGEGREVGTWVGVPVGDGVEVETAGICVALEQPVRRHMRRMTMR
jgi:hypothetical protein